MKLTRRTFVKSAATIPAAIPVVSRADIGGLSGGVNTGPRDVLVCVFQRGAADGIHLVPPLGDPNYTSFALANRPQLRLTDEDAQPLDGLFSLHNALAPLKTHYDANRLAIVHGVGHSIQNRSHFDAQKETECGVQADYTGDDPNGWIGRYLACTSPSNPDSVFRAVGFGQAVQKSLRGETAPIGMNDIETFGLRMSNPINVEPAEIALRGVYTGGADLLHSESIRALDAVDLLDSLTLEDPTVTYNTDEFAQKMMQIAQLIKADSDGALGLDVVCADIGGWDTHDDQINRLDVVMAEFGQALADFADDLGDEMNRVTVITMTEFGRRLPENAAEGTDHGNASVMFALGNGVNGNQVVANWEGIENMDDNEGLKVTIDWRDVLSELMVARLGLEVSALTDVFPDYDPPLAPALNLFLPRN